MVGVTPSDIAVKASEMLRALSHPLRLQIVEQLSVHEHRCVHELVDSLGAPQPTVSQHLRVLRGARLVVGRRVGKEVRYSLSDSHVSHIVLDALAHAEEPPDE
jgi:DNA-binding transcriptional ArsR family regulator